MNLVCLLGLLGKSGQYENCLLNWKMELVFTTFCLLIHIFTEEINTIVFVILQSTLKSWFELENWGNCQFWNLRVARAFSVQYLGWMTLNAFEFHGLPLVVFEWNQVQGRLWMNLLEKHPPPLIISCLPPIKNSIS